MGGALGQSHPCHAPGGRTWLKNFITCTLYTVHSIGQEGVVCTVCIQYSILDTVYTVQPVNHNYFILCMYVRKQKVEQSMTHCRAREGGDHGVPVGEVARTVGLDLRHMEYLILQNWTDGMGSQLCCQHYSIITLFDLSHYTKSMHNDLCSVNMILQFHFFTFHTILNSHTIYSHPILTASHSHTILTCCMRPQ